MMPSPSQGPAALELVSPDPGPGIRLLQVEGALSSEDAARWRQALTGAMADNGVPTRTVVVDLRGCSFLAAVCLHRMLEASDELADQGGVGLRLAMDIGEPVARRIWAVGRDRFSFHPTTARALEACLREHS